MFMVWYTEEVVEQIQYDKQATEIEELGEINCRSFWFEHAWSVDGTLLLGYNIGGSDIELLCHVFYSMVGPLQIYSLFII